MPALHARAVSIVQAATGRPESYLVNEEDGHMLNVGAARAREA